MDAWSGELPAPLATGAGEGPVQRVSDRLRGKVAVIAWTGPGFNKRGV
jgi:hypothetical protein